MENFEHSFSIQGNRKRIADALWFYYLYVYAPRMVRMFICALCFLFSGVKQGELIFLLLAAAFAIILVVEFPIFLRRVLKAVAPTGVFDKETHFHFYANKFSNRCGKNENVTEYSSFTGYFRYRKAIFLLMGNQLYSCGFAEKMFGDKIGAFVSCLNQSGVKPLSFFSLKRWGLSITISALFILYTIVFS